MSPIPRWKTRHTVLVVLFITYIICYLDRMVMSVAIPYIAKDFNLSPLEMGAVMSAFFASYALCQIPGGILSDRFGARKVMSAALVWWSAFTAFTGLAGSLAPMLWIRLGFGIGEGVFPPAAIKSISNWFPLKERGTAIGWMFSSNALGPALAPLFVVAVMASWGWRAVFYTLFIPGIIAAILAWVIITDKPSESKSISPEELSELTVDEPVLAASTSSGTSLMDVLRVPIVWQCFAIWFAFDITLWGFMSWLPSYLVQARGFAAVKMGVTASLPFFAGTPGLVLGGWVSDTFFKNTRKTPIILTQLAGAWLLYMTYSVEAANLAVAYQTLAGFFLFMAMGSFWALPMSVIPKDAMGRASGIINTGGQIAGFISPMAIGYLVQSSSGSFNTSFMFLIAGTLLSCLVALTVKETRAIPVAA